MKKEKKTYCAESLIDIDKAYELWDWAAKFKVSAEVLKKAILAVGSSPEAVHTFLKR